MTRTKKKATRRPAKSPESETRFLPFEISTQYFYHGFDPENATFSEMLPFYLFWIGMIGTVIWGAIVGQVWAV